MKLFRLDLTKRELVRKISATVTGGRRGKPSRLSLSGLPLRDTDVFWFVDYPIVLIRMTSADATWSKGKVGRNGQLNPDLDVFIPRSSNKDANLYRLNDSNGDVYWVSLA